MSHQPPEGEQAGSRILNPLVNGRDCPQGGAGLSAALLLARAKPRRPLSPARSPGIVCRRTAPVFSNVARRLTSISSNRISNGDSRRAGPSLPLQSGEGGANAFQFTRIAREFF